MVQAALQTTQATQAWSHHLVVASPSNMDLYATHQAVWEVVSKKCLTSQPQLIFRADDGLIHVRVADAALKGSRARCVTFEPGQVMTLGCRLAPWRSVHQLRCASRQVINERVNEIFTNAGLMVTNQAEISVSQVGVQKGRKCRIGVDIELPYVECKVRVSVSDASLAAQAWSNGIGRGKRFGFGMLYQV